MKILPQILISLLGQKYTLKHADTTILCSLIKQVKYTKNNDIDGGRGIL